MPKPSLPTTLVELFADCVKQRGSQAALLEKHDGQFVGATWNELATDVHREAAFLAAEADVAAGDRVVQISENRREWITTDLAILSLGAVHVPLHTTLAAEQLAAQIVDCGANVVILGGQEQAEKLAAVADSLPEQLRVYSHDECPSPHDAIGDSEVEHVGPLLDAVDDTAATDEAISHRPSPDDLATILYTSGTTGEPKGVMLSHRNLVGNAVATLGVLPTHEDDLRLSFLPWSHVFERTCGLYVWIASVCRLAIAESREKIVANCQELQPTLLNGVPYFFDKLHRALESAGTDEKAGSLLSLLGGQMRVCITGGAALPLHIGQWFERQNLPIIEGYGLTETSPVIACCRPDDIRIGTVGPAVEGAELKIADDGEVLTRGVHVMQGYYEKPKATAQALRDGWFHTGDLGTLDADGFLTLTGRKKEILVTAAGKNVAPVQIESLLTRDPTIDQALVIGDGRNYLAALLVPNSAAVAADLGLPESFDLADLANPRVQELIEQRIATQLCEVSHHEQIRRFALLPREFSIERGELTPTLKLRRHVIVENFAHEVASLYDS